MQIVEPQPWVIGQSLTGTNGMAFVATGPNSFKMAAPEAPEPPEEDPPRQIAFCPGDVLPDWMQGKVEVCLLNGELQILCADEPVPTNANGTVIIDPVTGKPTFNQRPVKPEEDIKNYVEQSDEPTKEQVESGVCIWRNSEDGCLYTVTINADGSCTWYSSDKGDTNTFATVIQAPASGVDDYGNPYSASSDLIVFADGTQMCVQKTNELGPAVSVDPDDAATHPANSGIYEKQCLVDADGNMVGFVDSTGSHFIDDEDDEVGPSVEVDPDDQASWPTAPVAPHDLQFLCGPDGNICGVVTASGNKPITKYVNDGYSQNGVTGPSDLDPAGNPIVYVDQYGDPIAEGTTALHQFDGAGNYIGSFCTVQMTQWIDCPNDHQPMEIVERDVKGNEVSRAPFNLISPQRTAPRFSPFQTDIDIAVPGQSLGIIAAVGTVTLPDFETFGCPQNVMIYYDMTYTGRVATEGKTTIRAQYSLNGGAWRNLTGSSDEICWHGGLTQGNATNGLNYSCEQNFFKIADFQGLVNPGVQSVRLRLDLQINELIEGAVTLSSHGIFFVYNDPAVCFSTP